jgi:hypothetical protein
MSYREHFAASRFKGRDTAIAASDAADANLLNCLDTLAGTMTAVLEPTRATTRSDMPPEAAAAVADRAGAVINGNADASFSLRQDGARWADETIDRAQDAEKWKTGFRKNIKRNREY